MRSSFVSLLLGLTAFAMSGCVSLSSMQTARTVKKQEFVGFFGAGTQSTKFKKYSEDASEKELQESLEKLSMPVLEAGGRYGVVDNVDVGGKFSLLPGSMSLGGKYMMLGKGSEGALATGLDVTYGSFEVSSGSGDVKSKNSIRIIDATVPLYTSYDVSDWFSLYLTPRFGTRMTTVKQSSDIDGTSKSEDKSIPVWGVNTGFMLGWFAAEYAVLDQAGKNTDAFLQQITLGVIVGTDNLDR